MNCDLISKTAVALLAIAVGACGSPGEQATGEDDILVAYGDSALTLDDVMFQIPSGLASADSAELFDRIVERWVEGRVLEDVAKENVVDLERIDRLASDYRNRLIIDEYLRKKSVAFRPDVDEKEVKEYYETHRSEFILRQPLIKGIFIKTSEKDDKFGSVKRWMAMADDASVDELETYGMRMATKYEYFEDRWLEWNLVADEIPYRFHDADAFLKTTRDFETRYGGSVYLLHVSAYLPTGSEEPFESASERISGMLSERKRNEYMENLKFSIYKKAVKEGKLKAGRYDPLGGKNTGKENKKETKNKE